VLITSFLGLLPVNPYIAIIKPIATAITGEPKNFIASTTGPVTFI